MEKIKCPICHNLYTEELLRAGDYFGRNDHEFGVRKCLVCKIIFTHPILDWKDLRKEYPEIHLWKKTPHNKNKFNKLTHWLEKIYIGIWSKYEAGRLLKFAGNGKLLDVGCGTGFRLKAIRKRGFNQCYGIDPSKLVTYTKKEGFPVEQKSLEEFDCPENSFDIITLYHVFEHIDKPVDNLKKIKKILKPNGTLVIQVPNFNSIQSKLFGKKWNSLSLPVHCFHYNLESLNNLLSQNGFKIKTIDYTVNFLHPIFWGLSLSNKINPQLIWQTEGENKKSLIFYKVLQIILILISIIPAWIETLLGRGAHFTIYAINQKNEKQ